MMVLIRTRETFKNFNTSLSLTFSGVPISTQWSPKGHFYPIQIAQFGLSHYSKHLTEPKPVVNVLDDGESGDTSQWLLPDRKSQLVMKTDEQFIQNSLIEFDTTGICLIMTKRYVV